MGTQRHSLIYRALEIFPGALVWTTLVGSVMLSYAKPYWVAIFIILFDIYWVLKAINTSLHLLNTFRKLRIYTAYDFQKRLVLLKNPVELKKSLREKILVSRLRAERHDLKNELRRLDSLDLTNRVFDWREVYHVILLTTYSESLEVLDQSIRSFIKTDFPKEQIFLILAAEDRERDRMAPIAETLTRHYAGNFFRFVVTWHPSDLPGEIKAKGANLTYACREAALLIRQIGIPVEHVVVSAFDSDTVVAPNYFSYLTYAFLTAEKPYRTSYQPLQVYNNNIWDAPAITRLVAVANSFWQMVEASRPDRVVTFSSHAMTLKALLEVGFWPVDTIPDDSRIFWKSFLHYHGDYRTQPLFTHVSLDAVLAESYFKSLIGQYKQKRRWAWGASEIPYVISGFLQDHKISFRKKFIYAERLIEGHYFWATASVMIAFLGWLPLLVGGPRFEQEVFAFNLPILTKLIMQIATVFLIFSVYINLVLLPPRPAKYSKWRTINMILQWVFVPVVSSVFGSFPAIDAQTRLMLGRYMEFWVTPKARKSEIKDPTMVFSPR